MRHADPSAASAATSSGRRWLELLATFLLFGWISCSPAAAPWLHTATVSFVAPLAVLVAALLAMLGGRLWHARIARGESLPRLIERSDLSLAALLLVLLCAAAAGHEQPELSWRLGGQLVVSLACTYYVGKGLAQSPHLPVNLFASVLPLSLAVALYGLYEVATATNPLHDHVWPNPYYELYRDTGRPVSTQGNPAPLGTYLLVTSFLCAGAVLTRQRATKRILLGLIAIHVLCLLLTRSRAAFVGLVVGVLVVVGTGRAAAGGLRLRALGFGAAAVAVVMTIASCLPPPLDQFGFHRVFGAGGFMAQDRAIRQSAALAMWRDHPFFGVGFGHYPVHFVAYAGADPKIAHLAGTPDNTYLTLVAENGILGAVAFLCFLAALVARGLRAHVHATGAHLLRAATAGLIALLVNFVGYSALYWSAPCMLFGTACGIVSGLAGASAVVRRGVASFGGSRDPGV